MSGALFSKVVGRLKRDASRLLARRTVTIAPFTPIVSFTFDDFPRSALHTAGKILLEHGFRGTYYASFGLMNRTAPTGEIFTCDDLSEFTRQGHELGCHTFDHCHSWDTAPTEFEASILRNKRAAADLLPGLMMKSLSYPISGPRPATKRRIRRHFHCARGGGQRFNRGATDVRFLSAFFIEQSRENFAAIQQVIDFNAQAKGWLIFVTHDVSVSPTPYGCPPGLFEKIVASVAQSRAQVLPVYEAFSALTGHPTGALKH